MRGILIVRKDVLNQPVGQSFPILDSRLAKAEKLSDLRTVILNGASLPRVLFPRCLRHADMAGNVFDDSERNLLALPGKAALMLKELQQYREAQAGRSV